MPASVLIDSTPVESEEMALEENSAPNTCTAAQVNEPMAEQVRLEFEMLQLRAQKAEAVAEQAKENLRRQSNLLTAWRRKLTEQESIIAQLKQDRDKQMCDIASSVLLVQAELRKEQVDILRLVEEKETIIASQKQQIRALLVLNRKLASSTEKTENNLKNDKRRHTVSFPKKVRFDNDKTAAVRRTHSDAHCNNINVNLNDSLNGHCSDEEELLCNGGETVIVRNPWDKSAGRHVPTLEALDEVAEDVGYVNNEGDCKTPSSDSIENLTEPAASFNRVMSTHKSVTKPKDVKYKKINRVKSRSLEELRGKLRNWTHPFFVSEKTT